MELKIQVVRSMLWPCELGSEELRMPTKDSANHLPPQGGNAPSPSPNNRPLTLQKTSARTSYNSVISLPQSSLLWRLRANGEALKWWEKQRGNVG